MGWGGVRPAREAPHPPPLPTRGRGAVSTALWFSMTGWARKVFWTQVQAVPEGPDHTVRLDGRAVKTPAKRPLLLPTVALAEAVAAEWAAQRDTVDPRTMPMTRLANTAIDRIAPQQAEVAALVADYGGTDLLCHRAEGPAALAELQVRGWNPLLDWAAATLGARLQPTAGILPRAQDPAALAALTAQVTARGPFRLAALHDLVAISGSLVLGLAVQAGRLTAEEAFALSRLDENWQAALWGEDAEALAAASAKAADMEAAGRFSRLCGAQDC